MPRLRKAVFALALLAFGAVLPASVGAQDLEPDRCNGPEPPLCQTRTTKVCTDWYKCGQFTICCSKWETETKSYYFPVQE